MNESILVYPAILTPDSDGYTIEFPDLSCCVTEGDTLAEALNMGKDAMEGWLYSAQKHNEPLPKPSDIETIALDEGQFTSLVVADLEAYRRRMDSRAVKKTLTIPSWLNEKADAARVNYSQILQDGLRRHLGL